MKPVLPVVAALAIAAASCMSESNWDTYADWRKANDEWYLKMVDTLDAQGNNYYTKLSPAWNPGSGVLIHFFNDRSLTAGNLSPLETSIVDMKYIGRYYNLVPFDSSYTNTAAYGDSIYRSRVGDNIDGWQIALNAMRVGDSVEVVIPYPVAYGANGYNTIPPYSVLRFNMKLVDIPAYELREPLDD
ncbi:MAG: FKBP-type peptidyl-prolyl cis-trans isomerase [Paramuribaculum sp.]|nr:FKBP-type peptidyl-prolyl cis-trans isomerase [Paramuribaculum sp.]MDE7470586.1 FKBP-type peptidyl-prolyl cis-trans isomerase [Paramuribaculum sp.]